MVHSGETTEVYSIGTEPAQVLGFVNERDLEEALIPLMEEIEQKDLIVAQVIIRYYFAAESFKHKEQTPKWFRMREYLLALNIE